MSRAQELLDAATPVPWEVRADPMGPLVIGPVKANGKRNKVALFPMGAKDAEKETDAALIVYAVNALPAYEAAREALEELLNFVNEGDLSAQARKDARAALDCLRDQVQP